MNWRDIISNFGGTTIVATAIAAVAAYLGRILIERMTNREIERVRTNFTNKAWHFQQSWTEQEKFFAGILTSLYKLERSLRSALDYFQEPGSEYNREIENSEHFKTLSAQGISATEEIHNQMGAASIHLPDDAYDELEKLFVSLWDVEEHSLCTADYLQRSLGLVIPLRTKIRSIAKRSLAIEQCR